MNDLVIQPERQLTAVDVRAHVNLVQEVMKAVMKDGTHYGTIPGTPKPSLWKPGAEVLAATFRIAVSYRIEDLSSPDAVRYRITAIGTHQTSGVVMGEGMGECSSNEEKYKWRKAYDDEFSATPEDKKRIKYGKYTAKQVRTEPADLANTILKMACKRAQVAMTLNVTAASDIFTQDIEDLPEELRPDDEPVAGPKSKSAPETKKPSDQPSAPIPDSPMKEGQIRILKARMEGANVSDEQLQKQFGKPLAELMGSQFNDVQIWVREMAEAANA
ncbi:MAG: hypothetical protein ACYC36_03760 [Bellilinea sp.]